MSESRFGADLVQFWFCCQLVSFTVEDMVKCLVGEYSMRCVGKIVVTSQLRTELKGHTYGSEEVVLFMRHSIFLVDPPLASGVLNVLFYAI